MAAAGDRWDTIPLDRCLRGHFGSAARPPGEDAEHDDAFANGATAVSRAATWVLSNIAPLISSAKASEGWDGALSNAC